MKTRTFRAGAVAIGGTMLAATILTGCGTGPKVTLNGTEVSSLDKSIEAVDTAWAQQRASGSASNVDKDSRCYAQITTDGVLAKQAICGPIHYLGNDDQSWETVDWLPTADGKDKVKVTADKKSFSKGDPAANTSLYRPDGKKAPDGLQVPEPDTKTADATQAIWSSATPASTPASEKKTKVVTPDVTITMTGMKVSDRVGDASNRLKAGDGNKFVSADVLLYPYTGSDSSVDLAFVSDGKTYPIGKAKQGNVAMALPEDAKDAVLALTYDGLTQKVSLADGKLDSKATAYYDGFSDKANGQSLQKFKVGPDIGTSVTFVPKGFSATRTAYDPKVGWAPEGKAWLVVTGTPDHDNFVDHTSDGTRSYTSPTKVTAGTVKNVSGNAFSADAKKIYTEDAVVGLFGGMGTRSTAIFEVPAGVGSFSVSLTLNVSGPQSYEDAGSHPPTASLDGNVPPFELTFDKLSK